MVGGREAWESVLEKTLADWAATCLRDEPGKILYVTLITIRLFPVSEQSILSWRDTAWTGDTERLRPQVPLTRVVWKKGYDERQTRKPVWKGQESRGHKLIREAERQELAGAQELRETIRTGSMKVRDTNFRLSVLLSHVIKSGRVVKRATEGQRGPRCSAQHQHRTVTMTRHFSQWLPSSSHQRHESRLMG